MSAVTITPEMRAAALAEAMREVTRGSRVPFKRILAEFLGCSPREPSIMAFAAQHPDKWAQAVSLLAALSGYEKGVVELNIYNVGQLSDVELLRELHRGEGELQKLGIRRAPVLIEQPAAAADTREAPGPAAPVARDVKGDYVDPTEAV